MITISLCMIVKDEENTLARCLDSVKNLVDEIIIVDTGSNDETKNIAREYTNLVLDFDWIDDFSAARNFSFSKATKDYILWLDADDVILEEDQKKIKELKKSLNENIDVVMMKYNVAFDEMGKANFSFYRERLSKRNRGFLWKEPIHEYLVVGGQIINVDIAITHKKLRVSDPKRNVKIYDKMIKENKKLSPRGLYYYARELKDNGRTEESIEYYENFLDSNKGWSEDNISACYDLSQCYKKIGKDEKILSPLLNSFKYDLPRAHICCSIGSYYKEKKDYKRAIFWYEIVTHLEKPQSSWGFIMSDYWDFIPNIELCLCYYHIGDIEKSFLYHKKSSAIKPHASQVLYNENFFRKISDK